MAGGREVRAGKAYVEIALRDRVQAGLARISARLRGFAAGVGAVGRQLLAMGAGMGVPLAFATKVFVGFDDQIRQVRAVTQATDEQFAKLRATALELGRTTSFTSAQVASLMTELGRAGFSPDQINEMTSAVLDLSRATSTDATLASGIMAAAIRQFSLQASDATRVADALTVAANKSFNTVETLGESLQYAGPVANDFNMSIEDTLAILGALGNVGIQGSNAGTALRRMLIITGAEAKKLQGIFGVSFVDAAGNARPLVDVLDEVNRATAGLGTAARAQKFNEAFGLLGITGASAVSRNTVNVRELRDALANAGGVAARTHKEMESGLGGTFRRIWSAAEGVAIAIGDALAPALQSLESIITENLGGITKWIATNKGMIVGAVAVVAGITAAGAGLLGLSVAARVGAAALGMVSRAVSVVTVLFGTIGSAIALPFKLLSSAAATAASVVGGTLRRTMAVAAGVFSGLATGARVAFVPIVTAAASAGAAIGQRIGAGVGAATAKTAMFAAQAVPAVIKAVQGIGPAARSAWSMIKTTADPAYLKATWADIRAAAGRAFRAMRSDAFSFYKLLRTSMNPAYLKATWASVRTGAGVAFRSARASVFGFYNALRTARGAAAGLVGTMARIGGGLGRGIGRLGGAAGGLVGAAGMLGAMGIGGVFAPLLAMAPLVLGVLGSIGTAVAAVASPVGLLAAAVAAGAVAWVKWSSSGQAAWRGLLGAIQPIVTTLQDTFGAVKDAILGGNWALAGRLAIAGLKLAVFQGLVAIQDAFPGVFGAILRTVGKIGDGLVTAWGKVTAFLTDQWNSWGKATLDTILEVAGMIPDIWQQAVESMANSILAASAKGGVMGALASKLLGVDMSQEQAQAELAEIQRRQVTLRTKSETAGVVAKEIASGAEANTGRKLNADEIAAKQRYLAELQAQVADLRRGGSGSANVGQTVDVLADARQAVKAYTDQLRSDLANARGTAGEGPVSQALDSFAAKLESGLSVTDAQADLAAAKAELAAATAAAKQSPGLVDTGEMQGQVDQAGSGLENLPGAAGGVKPGEVQGTFNAMAIRGLGADSLAQRTAKATETVAKNTDELVKEARNGNLVFA